MVSVLAATYSLWLSNPAGVRLKLITNFIRLRYLRVVNKAGILTLILPRTFDRSLLKRDSRLEIWRRLGNREYLETDTIWLVRRAVEDVDADIIIVTAHSALELAARRGVAYASGSSEALKNDAGDTVIMELAEENLGGSAASDRDWSSLISFASASGGGPSVHKACAWRSDLLQVMQEVAEDAAEAGTPVFFDIISPTENTLEFRTWLEQRGVDRTTGQHEVKLAGDFGTLRGVRMSYDYRPEFTVVYALGGNTRADRVTAEQEDSARTALSPFGRVEHFVNASNIIDPDKLAAEALAVLREGRPIRTMEGQIQNRPGMQYGLDWGWGDKVLTELGDEVVTVRIDMVRVTVDRGRERIDTRLRVED